jgi:Na+-driven multidrug efflux pump
MIIAGADSWFSLYHGRIYTAYFFRIEGGPSGHDYVPNYGRLDIALDLLFTVIMDMGMFGLALATVLSALAAVLMVAPFLFFRGGGYRFVPLGKFRQLAIGVVIAGSPPALNNLYTVIRTLLLNFMLLAVGGPVAVASFAFINSVNTLARRVSGISQTVSPLVGVFYGEHDVLSIREGF